jgi:hypothetical protein
MLGILGLVNLLVLQNCARASSCFFPSATVKSVPSSRPRRDPAWTAAMQIGRWEHCWRGTVIRVGSVLTVFDRKRRGVLLVSNWQGVFRKSRGPSESAMACPMSTDAIRQASRNVLIAWKITLSSAALTRSTESVTRLIRDCLAAWRRAVNRATARRSRESRCRVQWTIAYLITSNYSSA